MTEAESVTAARPEAGAREWLAKQADIPTGLYGTQSLDALCLVLEAYAQHRVAPLKAKLAEVDKGGFAMSAELEQLRELVAQREAEIARLRQELATAMRDKWIADALAAAPPPPPEPTK